MARPRVLELGQGRQLLDTDFRDTEGLVAAYLLPEEEGWTLIETGPSVVPHRTPAPESTGPASHAPKSIMSWLRTSTSTMREESARWRRSSPVRCSMPTNWACPTLSTRRSSSRALGEPGGRPPTPCGGLSYRFPLPGFVALHGGERFPLKGGELTVLATPGHAKHHVSFFDSAIRGIFTGDGAGVRLERSSRIRPAVPPPDLDLELLFSSLEAMRQTDPAMVLYSHFGPSPDGAADLGRYRQVVEEWRDVALTAARERRDAEFITERLREHDRLANGATSARPYVVRRSVEPRVGL